MMPFSDFFPTHQSPLSKFTTGDMCTLQKRGKIFFLTLTGTGSDEHRLSPAVIASIRSSLSEVKSQSTPGSVLITLAEGNRFFSNGLDTALAKSSTNSPSEAIDFLSHMVRLFKDVIADLFELPMPTIAAVTGHAAAAGFLLAISHDYVVMRRDRGVLYMSEVDMAMTLPEYFTAVFRCKVTKVDARRDTLLRGKKIKADEALVKGLIDSAHDNKEQTVDAAVSLGEELSKRNWDGEVYAEIRKSLYPELFGVLGLTKRSVLKGRL